MNLDEFNGSATNDTTVPLEEREDEESWSNWSTDGEDDLGLCEKYPLSIFSDRNYHLQLACDKDFWSLFRFLSLTPLFCETIF